jgi:BON domain-containing protein
MRGNHVVFRRLLIMVFAVAVVCGCATVDPWTDTRIESEVKARLVATHEANLTRLGVVSREKTVYLSGTVESGEQKEQAETVAKGVPGVKRVVSTLEIASDRSRGSAQPSK